MISVIIVSYNSIEYIDNTLDSLFRSSMKKFRVILVDNASVDKSVEHVRNKYPEVTVIALEKNVGFAAGNNVGLKVGMKDNPEYVFFLNPDTITERKCMENLITYANQNTILQPLILLCKNGIKSDLVNTAGGFLNFLGFSYCGNYREKSHNFSRNADISVASGAAMLVPIKIIKKIGSFDEDFFMYHEDVDLSWRARISGFKIKLVPSAKIWHEYSFSRNKTKIFYAERNRLFFLYKNFSLNYLAIIFPAFFVNELLILVASVFNGAFTSKIKAYYSFLVFFRKTAKKRKLSMRLKTASERKLKNVINGSLNFSEIKIPGMDLYSFLLDSYWKICKLFV